MAFIESLWGKIRVKRLATKIGSGKTPSGGSETYVDQGVLFLRSQNIHFDGLMLDDVAYIDGTVHREMRATRVALNDVLLNITGASLGRVARVPEGVGEANVNQHVCIIRPNAATDSRYLTYGMSARFTQGQIQELQVGGNRDGLNFEQVGNLELPSPPLEEQRRIADFLDAETARIDALGSLRKTQRARLDERGYATVSEVLVPGILSSPSEIWPWVWLPEMPADRPLVRLGYVCRLQTGLTVDGKREVSDDMVTHPYLRVANVQTGRVDLDNLSEITVPTNIASRATLRAGDVLMTEGGDLDKLGRGTVWHGEVSGCLHQNHVFALRPENTHLEADYLALMTRTLHGRNYFESTGIKTTNLASTNSSKILSFPIPLPSVAEQRNLAKRAQAALDSVANASRLLDRQLKVLAERRQALITAAVTGQIDVSTASGRGIEE
ncbi:restriction endonuclease subunit S [Streptomyces sp. NPDC020125]|uniref:restriction endonuclease subunit S n=1 Tax=Streptomyces sp. NPDC020125 TaxID=3154593 RepID=UPI0033FB16B9